MTPPTKTIASSGIRKSREPAASRSRPMASTPAAFHLSATLPTSGRIVKLGTENARSARPASDAEPPMSSTYSGIAGVTTHWFA
jgi:hypothetical protein